MDMRRVVAACAVCLLICCVVALFTEEVFAGAAPGKPGLGAKPSAPGKPVPGKPAIAEKERTGPTKLQKALGLGSIVVMIAVVKYL